MTTAIDVLRLLETCGGQDAEKAIWNEIWEEAK